MGACDEATCFVSFTALSSYSARARLLGNSIVVAAGTVFNRILLWHSESEASPGPTRVAVRLSLSGHQVGCGTSCASYWCIYAVMEMVEYVLIIQGM